MADSGKKQVPLRLSNKLYDAIAAWAEDDFRSINGQIEYLLSECVRQRKKNGKYKKVRTITSADKKACKVRNLKSGKRYYFKIRAYKKANNEKIYGSFSKAVVVKTK